jgi:ubiquinone/menaquinone biosynthesis C-methylase UbiE
VALFEKGRNRPASGAAKLRFWFVSIDPRCLVKPRDAIALLATALPPDPGLRWADFGAGEGTFARALAELLGPEARVYAVDRDARALAALNDLPAHLRRRVVPVVADLGSRFELPGLGDALLDGAVLANSLHYWRDASSVLTSLSARVKPGGRVVLIEYDGRAANPWVPYPIPRTALATLAATAGLSAPTITATQRSRYGGSLYVASSIKGRVRP